MYYLNWVLNLIIFILSVHLMLLRGFEQAYSPLGSPGTTWMKNNNILEHPIIASAAQKLGKTPAQVVLRWGIQSGHSVLPKSTNETRIKQNLDLFGWSIPDDLFAEFSKIEQASKIVTSFLKPDKYALIFVILFRMWYSWKKNILQKSLFFSMKIFTVFSLSYFDMQVRLLRGQFVTGPQSVYKTVDDLWDGEI